MYKHTLHTRVSTECRISPKPSTKLPMILLTSAMDHLLAVSRSCGGIRISSPAFVVPLLVGTVCGSASRGSSSSLSTGIVVLSLSTAVVVLSLSTAVVALSLVVPLLVGCLRLSSAVRGSSGPSGPRVVALSLMARNTFSMLVVH
jgi:hypothetical protein